MGTLQQLRRLPLFLAVCFGPGLLVMSDERTTRQRFVITVPGAVEMREMSATGPSQQEMSIHPATDVVISLTSLPLHGQGSQGAQVVEPPDVFILREGSHTVLRIRAPDGKSGQRATVSSRLIQYEVAPGSVPQLTISSLY